MLTLNSSKSKASWAKLYLIAVVCTPVYLIGNILNIIGQVITKWSYLLCFDFINFQTTSIEPPAVTLYGYIKEYNKYYKDKTNEQETNKRGLSEDR